MSEHEDIHVRWSGQCLPDLMRDERIALLERAVDEVVAQHGLPADLDALLLLELRVDLLFAAKEALLRQSLMAQARQLEEESILGS